MKTAFVLASFTVMALAATSLSQEAQYAPTIDPSNFVAEVDNPYFPLKPGTVWIYEGKVGKNLEHSEVRVISETRLIMGVTCRAIKTSETVAGKLAEEALDWYAQDKQGNVWYFGEDTKEYKNGKVVSTQGSWLAGVNGAQPGYVMKAKPVVGETYRQDYAKGQVEGMASVVSLDQSATVPTGSYQNVVVTKEWSALEKPPVYEQKYYAPGLGLVLITSNGSRLSLLEMRHP